MTPLKLQEPTFKWNLLLFKLMLTTYHYYFNIVKFLKLKKGYSIRQYPKSC